MANLIKTPSAQVYDTTNLVSQAINTTGSPVGNVARMVRLIFDWVAAGASTANPDVSIEVNLESKKDVAIEAIRSIYIDNSGSGAPVFVYFPDTQYTVVAAPQTIVIAPVSTGVRSFICYGVGFTNDAIRETIVHAYNFYQPGLVMQVSVSGVQPPVIPEVPAATGTFLYNGSKNITGTTSWSFPAVPFGTPDTNRIIVACVTVMFYGPTMGGVPSINIGGVGATVLQSDVNRADSFGTRYWANVLCYAVVPTDSSGTITVTSTSVTVGQRVCAIAVYGIINAQNTVPIDSQKNAVGPGYGLRSITLNEDVSGFGVSFSCRELTDTNAGTPPGPGAPTNMTLDQMLQSDYNAGGGAFVHTGLAWAHLDTLSALPVLVESSNSTVLMGATWR